MDSERTGKVVTHRFVEVGTDVALELTNASDQPLESIEVLTIFLKREETLEPGPSQAHIRFETIKRMQAREHSTLSHRTWIDGKPADREQDQLKRLQTIAGAVNPYVLDISWLDEAGKRRFQRIPVGH